MLPWPPTRVPLMLAPMQGLTNRALRALFAAWVQPDVVFTEFVRVPAHAGGFQLAPRDIRELQPPGGAVSLVVQLFGNHRDNLQAAALAAQAHGVGHVNLNLGCPYGRMVAGEAGGALLRHPDALLTLLVALRQTVVGSLSVKLRAGYQDLQEVFALLPVFEQAEVDFLVLHPRTVVQQYQGAADHSVTAQVVAATRLPVIANGDICTVADGVRVLAQTRAAGLMLGRAAIADPTLFVRLRARELAEPEPAVRQMNFRNYLLELLRRYDELFCGDAQVLQKLKEILPFATDPELTETVKRLRRAKTRVAFLAALQRPERASPG